MQSRVGSVAQLLFVDLIGSVVWFPVWWYTKGFVFVVERSLRALRYRAQAYALRIWIRNFFVPMYGQYDLVGRLVSVFMRFIVLVGRSIALVIEAIVYAVGVLAWVATPIAAVVLLLINLFGGILLP